VVLSDSPVDALGRDRDQLWAEAYKLYNDGAPWWLETRELDALARQEQDERYEPGVWDEAILDWIDDPKQGYETDGAVQLPIKPFRSTRDRVTVQDILVHGIRKPLKLLSQADRNQVAKCLVHAGWTHGQFSTGPERGKRCYHRPAQTDVTSVTSVSHVL